jgi:hypothetical protein
MPLDADDIDAGLRKLPRVELQSLIERACGRVARRILRQPV